MTYNFKYSTFNPNFNNLGYVIAVADLNDKHDRSAPSDYHWKILKCRMLIFSNCSILASPDKRETKRIHIIFNKIGDEYDRINSLFMKFSLMQEGDIRKPTPEVYQQCFHYTLTAKLAPAWNTLGDSYLVSGRDFLSAVGPIDGLQYYISSDDQETIIALKAVKINLVRNNDIFMPGEWVRILPSLFKAIIDEHCVKIPESARFKCYKDLRRHWKNIHGYRIPETEDQYYSVRFWRGEPLTYPKICVVRDFPIIIPVPKHVEDTIITNFVNYIKFKISLITGAPLNLRQVVSETNTCVDINDVHMNPIIYETQAVSLCTPTQHTARRK